MTVRRVVGAIGRVLIGIGVLLLLFVGYQLWGTNLAEARSQHSLRHDFEASLRTTTTTAPPTTASSTTTTEAQPPPPTGDAVAIIRIPKIGVDKAVVEGAVMLARTVVRLAETPRERDRVLELAARRAS